MCGRFFRHGVSWEEYSSYLNLFEYAGIDPPEPAYNIAPTQIAPIVRIADEDEVAPRGARHLAHVGDEAIALGRCWGLGAVGAGGMFRECP